MLAPGEGSRAAGFVSENGKYSVELTQGDNGTEVVVSVSQVEEEARTLQWSRKTEWPVPSGWPASLTGIIAALVSNDGDTVVLRKANDYWRAAAGVTVLREDGENKLSMAEIAALLESHKAPVREFFTIHPNSTGEIMFDFIWESKGWYCAFDPKAKNWLVIGLKDLKARRADEAEQRVLDQEGRRRALKLVAEHQPGLVKGLLNQLRTKVASLVSDVGNPPNPLIHWRKVAPAYEVLAAQRHPQDKVWLEKLLNGVGEDQVQTVGYFVLENTTFLLHSHQRALADGLLREWNGIEEQGLWMEFPPWQTSGGLSFLGAFRGEVRLPVPTSTNSGNLLLYLIPAELQKAEWENRTSVIRMNVPLHRHTPPGAMMAGAGLEKAGFIFSTVAPGEYRLKALWDKRPPHTAVEPGGGASPGDYESAETEPFMVKAGKVLEGFVLNCTNRVGSAEQFYAEDAVRKQQEGERAALAQNVELSESLRGRMRKVVFEAPLKDWVLDGETSKPGEPRLARIALGEGDKEKGESAEVLELFLRGLDQPHTTAEIIDEHGCRFPGSREYSRPASPAGVTQLRFPVFPRVGTFKLEVRLSYGNKPLGNWTLTNAAPVQVAAFQPEPLPARREIEDAVLELEKIQRETGAEVELVQGRNAWELRRVEFVDETGNRAGTLSRLCRELERVKVETVLHRRPGHEFPAEQKWTVEMDEPPERGEYRNLGLSKEVQGVKFRVLAITAEGEFTYENSRVVQAQEQLDSYSYGMNAWGGRNSAVFVKLGPNELYSFDSRARHVVVSRAPHVSVQVEGLKEGQFWALLEEQLPIYHQPRETSPGRTLFFLPVNRVSIEETKGLTLVVFEPKTVEFVAELGQ